MINHECGHVVPHKFGGSAEECNLLAICIKCNDAMGSANLFEYMIKNNIKIPDYSNSVYKCIYDTHITLIRAVSDLVGRCEVPQEISVEYRNKVDKILSDYKRYDIHTRYLLINVLSGK